MIHSPGHMLPVKYCFLGYTSGFRYEGLSKKSRHREQERAQSPANCILALTLGLNISASS